MNETLEYAYNDRDDLINKSFLINKELNKLCKKYRNYPNINLAFQKNEQTKTIKLVKNQLLKYPEEIRDELLYLFRKVYGEKQINRIY